jgi:hypothetical protein
MTPAASNKRKARSRWKLCIPMAFSRELELNRIAPTGFQNKSIKLDQHHPGIAASAPVPPNATGKFQRLVVRDSGKGLHASRPALWWRLLFASQLFEVVEDSRRVRAD